MQSLEQSKIKKDNEYSKMLSPKRRYLKDENELPPQFWRQYQRHSKGY